MNKRSFAAILAVSLLSAGVCRAGLFEDAASASGGDFKAMLGARTVQFAVPEVPAAKAEAPSRAFELYCGGGKLQLQFKDSSRFTAVVNDAAVASALRAAAARFFEGEQRLVGVKFSGPSSFTVADLQKSIDGTGYVAGQFAPRLDLLGGGRVKLVLTYFRMNNSHSYDYNEVASFEFDNCVK